jgi:hypothetical protein
LREHQHDVGGLAQGAFGIDCDGDEGDPEPARIVDQLLELFGLAGPRQDQQHVVGRDHAEIAVARISGVHKKGRRPGGGKRRGDLAADVPRFAHAGHDHPAARLPDRVDGGHEMRSQAVGHSRR